MSVICIEAGVSSFFSGIFVTGCTGDCQFDNFRCSRSWGVSLGWWHSRLSVRVYLIDVPRATFMWYLGEIPGRSRGWACSKEYFVCWQMAVILQSTVIIVSYATKYYKVFIILSLHFVPSIQITNSPLMVWITAWCQPGDKPLSEPLVV